MKCKYIRKMGRFQYGILKCRNTEGNTLMLTINRKGLQSGNKNKNINFKKVLRHFSFMEPLSNKRKAMCTQLYRMRKFKLKELNCILLEVQRKRIVQTRWRR